MTFNPEIHKRKSIRLRGYDYTRPGAYFITICTHNRACVFGDVRDGVMQLNEWGQIVADAWAAIPDHFERATFDAFVVMPNHIHAIVWLRAGDDTSATDGRGEAYLAPTNATPLRCAPQPGFRPQSVASVVASFKSAVTKRINESRGTRGVTVWQRNFYEHIVRDDAALHAIRQYIADNPANWPSDELYADTNS